MSDIGLNSTIYQVSNKYLELLNNFLVDVNYSPEKISQRNAAAIATMINKLLDKNSKDFQIQVIHVIIDRYFRSKRQNTKRILEYILKKLRNKEYTDKKVVSNISAIATALDDECDTTFSRMQGKL